MINIETVKEKLDAGILSSEALVHECFGKIEDQNGQGAATFIHLYKNQALNTAREIDKARKEGRSLPPYAGVPISVKDLFDIKGEVTTAGSEILKNNEPAANDAPVIKRLKEAGFIIIGRTNMTEFAYSGLGLNPHYGTPLNPYDRKAGHIPGGSSSGAAISVTDGFAAAGLGTDTGGSCRIPAALCGIVGFKPTQSRVPLDSTIPLSPSLDSIGPLAQSVRSCAIIDAIISGETDHSLEDVSLTDLHFAIPVKPMLDQMDQAVTEAFEHSIIVLSKSGVKITEIDIPELDGIPAQSKNGGIAAAEAYAYHKERLEKSFEEYDPRVAGRIINWQKARSSEYAELLEVRANVIKSVQRTTEKFDALICPTVPTIAPTIKSLESDEEYLRQNAMMLRNPSLFNYLDRCAISIPCHEEGTAPMGLMLSGENGADRRLLGVAAAVEKVISPIRYPFP